MFQFPSNGKARVNAGFKCRKKSFRVNVSIPFKREGTCELLGTEEVLEVKGVEKFQFPSNGKARVNAALRQTVTISIDEFQFPSNGKARVNQDSGIHSFIVRKVSIPFKREGTCELPLFCTQSGRGSVHPKPNANCASLFLRKNSGQKSNKPL